ncbi:MAG TPA: hypothetical protein PLP19_13650 [bacterium]|nr:hypothetical protein [bacterium]HPN44532.1 hypothetical protein [bacterium]
MVTSALTAGALKLGYKLAEHKKWLPGVFYYKAALRELKNGDLRKAELYNSIALQKRPEFKNAQVVRELISMHKDARIEHIKKQISVEDAAISALRNRIAQTRKRLARSTQVGKWLTLAMPVLYLLICGGIFVALFRNIGSSGMGYLAALVCVILLIALFIIDRTALEKVRISRSVAQQEQRVYIQTAEREVLTRLTKREDLLNEIKMILE